ncbi:TioE family transcriptional regulator [Paenibacillus guangzhouensis]|uniref:TioE family transcriptional regulator n=1 Tax=Paenibacillus guangzhouensis TaxID=1473112 RepID=UPI0012675AAF|nr:TioE family transcriptional regulator [Paenibacillus guangzhouensis]
MQGQEYYKPIEIARELRISTSALRHYESWGVIPAPERSENGYRRYTQVHLAYFRCLRALIPGFGFKLTYEVLRYIQQAELNNALWLINEEQSKLQEEKRSAGQMLALLQDPELQVVQGKPMKGLMTIGEAAAITHVQASAIRHWEKEGLLNPVRNPDNGYRLYSPMHVRQILLISTLRKTVYYLDKMKEIVQAVEHHSLEKAKAVAEDALLRIHRLNRQQYMGVYQLMALCMTVGLTGEEEEAHLMIHYTFDQDRDSQSPL